MILKRYAFQTMDDIFSPKILFTSGRSKYYVKEGAICASFGILKIHSSRLECYDPPGIGVYPLSSSLGPDSSPRLIVNDSKNGKSYNLPWTAEDSLKEKLKAATENRADQTCLVLIGVSRGWNANGDFPENRCYLIAIGLYHSC